jgi:hypothetical protein
VSQSAVERLVASYSALPRAKQYRYSTLATNDFLIALDAVMQEHGQHGLRVAARALGVTEHSVRMMVRRRPVKPSQALAWPTAEQLQPLTAAWDAVLQRRAAGSHARPGTAP